jgi:hypothetical protein
MALARASGTFNLVDESNLISQRRQPMAEALPIPMTKNAPPSPTPYATKNEASASAVSWAAVAGGAFVTAALLLSLSALGAGMGLSSISPWANTGASATSVGIGALLWLAFAEIVACGIGGYMAGRLRTKWVDVHSDEVYFRDTAHGFLVWAVAFVILSAFLASAGTALAGRENSGANAARSTGMGGDANRYYTDSLFRSTQAVNPPDESMRAEIGSIFARGIQQGQLSGEDQDYVAEIVAAKTGLAKPEAVKRVSQVFGQDQQAVDNLRKAAAHSLYWMFVALLLGAFVASFSATLGGRRRDRMQARA